MQRQREAVFGPAVRGRESGTSRQEKLASPPKVLLATVNLLAAHVARSRCRFELSSIHQGHNDPALCSHLALLQHVVLQRQIFGQLPEREQIVT